MDEKLSLLENSSDSEVDFNINENYAKSYNRWRNKEELQKYKDLKKEEDDSESSSESAEDIPEFDEDFFRALSLLKGKDPRIYDKNFELFKNKEVQLKPKIGKEKPMYIKDYEINLALERGGKFSDEEDEPKICTYNKEQENLKNSLKEALKDSVPEDDDGEDLLQVRKKTQKEKDEEEADYVKWLKGEEKEVSENMKKDMSHLRNYWNDPELDEGEKYLRDYILKKRYLEKDDYETPTYEEITSGMLSDDEKTLEEQEKFEHKFNFRYEEPDEEFIKRYPRTVGDSLRNADNRRKQKREEKAERRKKEKEQRQEELKRLKALKRKEIEEKFMKLKEVSGQEEINLNESDIESDFDPDKHDRKMGEIFNDDYYGIEEEQKPEFPYDEELDFENWNTWSGEKIVDEEEKDDESENDSHEKEEPSKQNSKKTNSKEVFEKEMIDASLPKKKVRKKSLFAKVISQSKPIYDPDGKSFEDYLDEYYKLDYEDVVGDLPVRYKYRKVIPNDFGLTVDEILTADDRELNRWCSVKKTCQYRNDDEEIYDVQAYKKKAQNSMAKKKVFLSLYASKEIENDAVNEHRNNKNIYVTEGSSSLIDQDYTINEAASVMQTNSNDVIEQELNKDSSTHSSKIGKKSKKKKRKRNSESLILNTECMNASSDVNANSEDMSYSEDMEKKANDNNSLKCDDKNKTNKRKQKNGKHFSHMETESGFSADTEAGSVENDLALSNLEINSSRTKRKRKFSAEHSALVTSGSESDSVVDSTPQNKLMKLKHNDVLQLSNSEGNSFGNKRKFDSKNSDLVAYLDTESDSNMDETQGSKFNNSKHNNASNINDTPTENSNFVAGSFSEEPKKKKKKKNKKNKGNSAITNFNQSDKSQNHYKFKEKKHTENHLGEKTVKDSRLASFNINVKKFKNKKIYSNK